MKVAILEKWTEYERGWGSRPDGTSLHLTDKNYKLFVEDYLVKERQRNSSGKVPDEYTTFDSNPTIVQISDKLYKKLCTKNNKKNNGIWISNSDFNNHIKSKEIKYILK